MPPCGLDNAAERAWQLNARIDRLKPAGVTVTASMGVSAKPSGHAVDLEQLIRIADQAVYEAKSAGRNQVVVHGAGPRSTKNPLTSSNSSISAA